MQKIVIIHAGALGDFIMALPAMTALRVAYPGVSLRLVSRAHGLALATMAGLIERGIPFERSGIHRLFARGLEIPEALGAELQSADGIVSWYGFDDEAYFSALTAYGARVIIQPGLPPPGRSPHAADYLMETVMPFLPPGVPLPDAVPCVAITPAQREAAQALLPSPGGTEKPIRWIALHPGSGSPKKCWPGERFADLARALEAKGRQTVLIEGPADAPAFETFDARYGNGPAIRWRHAPLPGLAAALSLCERYVGNDSGITHLAAAVGVPTLALFGPTDPTVWGPRGRHVQIIHQPFERLTVDRVLSAVVPPRS